MEKKKPVHLSDAELLHLGSSYLKQQHYWQTFSGDLQFQSNQWADGGIRETLSGRRKMNSFKEESIGLSLTTTQH